MRIPNSSYYGAILRTLSHPDFMKKKSLICGVSRVHEEPRFRSFEGLLRSMHSVNMRIKVFLCFNTKTRGVVLASAHHACKLSPGTESIQIHSQPQNHGNGNRPIKDLASVSNVLVSFLTLHKARL